LGWHAPSNADSRAIPASRAPVAGVGRVVRRRTCDMVMLITITMDSS